MRKEKLKNESFWQIGMLPFVALWAGSYVIAWLGLLPVINWVEDTGNVSQTIQNSIAIAFILLVSALAQVQIVERLLKRSMRGWMLYTLIGTIITFFTFRDSSMTASSQFALLITSLSLLVPAPLVQTVWLWRRVKSAWLWPLASMVAAIAFILPLRENSGGDGSIVIMAALLYGLIQGGVMRYLITQADETEKSKVDFDVDRQSSSEEDSITRLQEADAPPVTWHSRDEAMQRRDR